MKKIICLLTLFLCLTGCSNERLTMILIPEDIQITLSPAAKAQATVATVIPEEVSEYCYTDNYVNFHRKLCYNKIGHEIKKHMINVLQNHYEEVLVFDSNLTNIPESCKVIFIPSVEKVEASRFTSPFGNSQVCVTLRLKAFSQSQEVLWSEDFYAESEKTTGSSAKDRGQYFTQTILEQIFDNVNKSLSDPQVVQKLLSK